MLFVPGNNPGMIKDAGIYGQDCIMFDLEDSVSLTEKDAARFLVYQALTSMDYRGKELVVRVNDPTTKCGVDDLEAIVRTQKAVIRLPKTEALLKGKKLTPELIGEAAELAGSEVSPISDVRASAEYRISLVKVAVRRSLAELSV